MVNGNGGPDPRKDAQMESGGFPLVAYETGTARVVFERQRAAFLARPFLTICERDAALLAIETLLIDNNEKIAAAVSADFGQRSSQETRLLDIFPAVSGLAYARRHLKRWMRPQRRHTSLLFAGARSRVISQPKGVVGIISPWNYPLQLVLGPLTYALAAGNRCMIKMAANAQGLCQLLSRLFRGVISEELVAFMPGVPASEFTALPFDHLVFTGSPASGRVVMRAAAEHLTPVTLELGGKSPTILAEDFDVVQAADRILYTKYMNAGQTCIAPDYLFAPQTRVTAFIEQSRQMMQHRYPDIRSQDYTAIINDKAYARLMDGLADAEAKGARIINLVAGSNPDPVHRKIPPTLVLDVHEGMQLMQEEIFGPILPVMSYRSVDEVLAYINARERPLALYLFTHDRALQERVLYNTLSGGFGINDCAVHFAQHDLPFGGVGNSGMGQYHAREGFLEFSKLRPVFTQAPRTMVALMHPPYGRTFERVFGWLMRLRHL